MNKIISDAMDSGAGVLIIYMIVLMIGIVSIVNPPSCKVEVTIYD